MIDGQAKDERADARSPVPRPGRHVAAGRRARLASAARGRTTPVAWVVVVLLIAYAGATLVESTAPLLSRGLFAVMGVSVVTLFALYPDGRLTPRWIVVPVSIEIALQAINVVSRFSLEAQPWWPWHLLVALGVTLIGGQVYRYRRRSSVAEREQTRWPLLAVLAMAFAYTAWALVDVGLGVPPEREAPLAVLLSVLPGVGFAVGLLAPRGVNVDVALRWCLLLGSVSVLLGTAILAATGLGRALGASAAGTDMGSGGGGGRADHSRWWTSAGGRPTASSSDVGRVRFERWRIWGASSLRRRTRGSSPRRSYAR